MGASALFVPAVGVAQECIPSCDGEDGRHLAITDGAGLDTLTDTTLDLTARVAVSDIDITDYISSETMVRFRVSNKYGGKNEWFKVEWLTIQGTCP